MTRNPIIPLAILSALMAAPAAAHVVAAPAVTYGVGVIAGQQAGLAHGITTTGIHSSHVGVCTNVHGAQVPC